MKKCKSDILKYPFATRCVKCWNSLPGDVVNSSTVNVYMSKLKLVYLDDFLNGWTLVDF